MRLRIAALLIFAWSLPLTGFAPRLHLTIAQPSIVRQPKADCSVSLQTLVNNTPAGGTLKAPACIYRESVTLSKPITLIGSPGTEIRGADVWTAWSGGGGTWTSANTYPSDLDPGPQTDPICPQDLPNCNLPEQVYIDGTSLAHVNGTPNANQFALDGARHVLLGRDPTGHVVEVTTRSYWITGSGGASNSVIQGFRMRYAANTYHGGSAIGPYGDKNWTIEDNVLSDAHAAVVGGQHGIKILRNDIFNGGQMGIQISGPGDGALVQGNRIHDNNITPYEYDWEAGGMKFGAATDVTVDSNDIFNNHGTGAWCDVSCSNVVYTNNRVHDNEDMGIMYEISSNGKILNNQIWQNGNAGIWLSSSGTTEVANNVIAWNNWGSIWAFAQDRGVQETGINIHDNICVQSGTAWPDYTQPKQQDAQWWSQDQGYPNGPLFAGSNQGSHNGIWYPNAEDGQTRFAWNGDLTHLSDFTKTPGGTNDYYLTDAQKAQLLTQARIPLKPLGPIPIPPAATATPKTTATVTATVLPTATADAGLAVTTNTGAASSGHQRTGSGTNTGLLIVLVLMLLVAGGGGGWYLWRRRHTRPSLADGGAGASLDADHTWGDEHWEDDHWTENRWTDEAWTAAREWDEPSGEWRVRPPASR